MVRLHAMIGEHVGDGEDPVVMVGIETERGPWVRALAAAGSVLQLDIMVRFRPVIPKK